MHITRYTVINHATNTTNIITTPQPNHTIIPNIHPPLPPLFNPHFDSIHLLIPAPKLHPVPAIPPPAYHNLPTIHIKPYQKHGYACHAHHTEHEHDIGYEECMYYVYIGLFRIVFVFF